MIGTLFGGAVGVLFAGWAMQRLRPAQPLTDLTPVLTALGLEEVRSGNSLFPTGSRRSWRGSVHGAVVHAAPTADGRVAMSIGTGPGHDATPLTLRPRRPGDEDLDWRTRWLVSEEVGACLAARDELGALDALHPAGASIPEWRVRDGVAGTESAVDRLDVETVVRLAYLTHLLRREQDPDRAPEVWWIGLSQDKVAPAAARTIAVREVASRARRSTACAEAWRAAFSGPSADAAVHAALTYDATLVQDALRQLADAVIEGRQPAPPDLAAALYRIAHPDDLQRLVAALSGVAAPPPGVLNVLVRIGDAHTAARLPALARAWPAADRARAAQVVAALVAVHGLPVGGGLTLPREAGELTVATAAGALTQPETAR